MSRIGKKPIAIPQGVTVKLEDSKIVITGPIGTLEQALPEQVTVKIEDNNIIVERNNEEKFTRQMHGTIRSLIANMVVGVEKGYEKKLKIVGIGYKASLDGETLVLNVGYSHPVHITPLEGVKITVASPTQIVVTGTDKQKVGETAAQIRAVRKPEPYLGKGIAYVGEHIRRKEGKKAGK